MATAAPTDLRTETQIGDREDRTIEGIETTFFSDDAASVDSRFSGQATPPPEYAQAEEGLPPQYEEGLELKASTPTATQRYDKTILPSYPRHVTIPPTYFSMMPPAIPPPPEGWIEFIHPEGQNYFYCPSRRVVTEANLRDNEIFQLIYQAASRVDGLIVDQELTLSTSTELLLELNDDNRSAKYYFVDHMRRTIFWLEHTATNALELPPVSSMTHLKQLFMQHYWTHVEYFPMHIAMPSSVEEELIAILSHACIDFMTSDLSTFPYTQEQCRSFIKIIQRMPESQRAEGFRNCVIARLWSEISGNYFVNMHGEVHARMSRNQRLLPDPDISVPPLIRFLNYFVHHRDALANVDIWTDWKAYRTHFLNEWRMAIASAYRLLAVIICSWLVLFTSVHDPALVTALRFGNLAAAVFCLVSVASGVWLTYLHRDPDYENATAISKYIENMYDKKYGYQVLAAMLAIPEASLLWGRIVFTATFITLCIYLPPPPLHLNLALYAGCAGASAAVVGLAMPLRWICPARKKQAPSHTAVANR